MYAINQNKLQRDVIDEGYLICFDLIDNKHSVIKPNNHVTFKVLKDDCILRKKNIKARHLIEGLFQMPNGYKRAKLSNKLKKKNTDGKFLNM